MEYDIIGDIHGQGAALELLLDKLGYRRSGTSWTSPPGRMIVFVGDFIDRGPQQVEVVATVRSLIEAGRALAVMGNHELNAIAWHRGFRPDTPKNRNQHGAFLAQVGEGSRAHGELIDWFLTLPLWLDLPELRVVHACWDPAALECLRDVLDEDRLIEDQLHRATVGRSNAVDASGAHPQGIDDVFSSVETLLKGIEVELPGSLSFHDKDGHERHHVRIKWWRQPPASYAEVSMSPLGRHPALESALPHGVLPGYDHPKPVFFGHYWRTGTPSLLDTKIACVDYSAGLGGPLVAYRWRGEEELDAGAFLAAQPG